MTDTWNPWHGCVHWSEGCAHCYVYRRDEEFGRDASQVKKTADFSLPVKRHRDGTFRIAPGSSIFTCLTSDFFIDKADIWRDEAWNMMRLRRDVNFSIITKRILRMERCLPGDWGDGWDNVSIGATMENQRCANERMPVFLDLPIKHRFIVCEPMLGPIDIRAALDPEKVETVIAGGESGPGARPLDYDWVLDLRSQCAETGVGFRFKQTGAAFIKDGRRYEIKRALQLSQARRANIDLPNRKGG